MFDSNQALSWIVLVRDRPAFERQFPRLAIERLSFLPWFSYLLTGGATRPNLVPSFLGGLMRFAERPLRALAPLCSLHWHIRIRKARA